MKKVLATLAGCLLVFSASAQSFQVGQIFLSPTATNLGWNKTSFGHEGSTNTHDYTRLGVNVAGGYVYSDKIVIEAGLGTQSFKSEDTPANMFNLYAGARYYLNNNLYGAADLMTMQGKVKDTTGAGDDDTAKSLGFVLKAGYDYFITEKFAIEPSISYTHSLSCEVEGRTDYEYSIFAINIGFVILL